MKNLVFSMPLQTLHQMAPCHPTVIEYTRRYLGNDANSWDQVQREKKAILALTNVRRKLNELRSIQIPIIKPNNGTAFKYLPSTIVNIKKMYQRI